MSCAPLFYNDKNRADFYENRICALEKECKESLSEIRREYIGKMDNREHYWLSYMWSERVVWFIACILTGGVVYLFNH